MIDHSFLKCRLFNNLDGTKYYQIKKPREFRITQCLPQRGGLLSSRMTRRFDVRASLRRLIILMIWQIWLWNRIRSNEQVFILMHLLWFCLRVRFFLIKSSVFYKKVKSVVLVIQFFAKTISEKYYFWESFHGRCLTGFWIRPCKYIWS